MPTLADLFGEPEKPRPEEKIHVLIVSGDMDNDDDVFEVIHPLSCPKEDIESLGCWHHTCLVEFVIEQVGVEDYFVREGTFMPFYRAQVLKPGIYLIKGWEDRYDSYEHGPEYDSGLTLVEY